LLVGLSMIFLLDYIDDRFSSPADVQSGLDEHLLGQIPTQKHKGTLAPLRENDPRHPFAESLRGLRSSLLYLPVEGERPKTILVTSAVPDEGKSTIALNLAITMAFAKVPVLLVDGDLRRGSLHKSLGLNSCPGVSEFLQEKASLEQCIVRTSYPGMDLIPCGKQAQNPGELLLGPRLEQFLRQIYDLYQYVIFDSSPIMAADDSTSLAPKLDAAIFVVRFGHSSAKVAKRALELLSDRQANVIGVVCNDVSEVYGEYYQYKYSEYYGSQKSAI